MAIKLTISIVIAVIITLIGWSVQYQATKDYCPVNNCDGLEINAI